VAAYATTAQNIITAIVVDNIFFMVPPKF